MRNTRQLEPREQQRALRQKVVRTQIDEYARAYARRSAELRKKKQTDEQQKSQAAKLREAEEREILRLEMARFRMETEKSADVIAQEFQIGMNLLIDEQEELRKQQRTSDRFNSALEQLRIEKEIAEELKEIKP
ncbi:MAG: hypothetical protein EZS28_003900 [Streblomastix strix]|uniref:Uncharacterized protein n=1 Tax=Streblomastix strix TaxID=222440 RepID=A0A5J4X1D4_9EUKA|nr:MAG: hypothetical protein EZS28_003900 [Streblomastix strix]